MQQFPAVTESKIWILKVFLKTQKFGQSIVGKRDRIGKKMWGDTSRGWPTTSTTTVYSPARLQPTGPGLTKDVRSRLGLFSRMATDRAKKYGTVTRRKRIARPTVTFSASERHHSLTGTKLLLYAYRLLTKHIGEVACLRPLYNGAWTVLEPAAYKWRNVLRLQLSAPTCILCSNVVVCSLPLKHYCHHKCSDIKSYLHSHLYIVLISHIDLSRYFR